MKQVITAVLAVGTCLILLCPDAWSQMPNIRIHPNPSTYQYELSVAAHPLNPRIALVACVARTANVDRLGWYYTTDGGITWSGRDTLPTHVNLAMYMRDPAAAIDLDGNLYVNGFSGNGDVFVARSTNGGALWTQVNIANTSGHERPHMTIDRNPYSAYKNYIYAGYTDLNAVGHPVLVSRSTDQGQSFSPPMPISGISGPDAVGVNLVVGPDNVVYATWSWFDSPPFINPLPFHLGFNRSTDGGSSWGTPKVIQSVNYNGSLAKPLSFFNYPVMAVDGSNGPRRGWLYVAYTEGGSTNPDIFLIRSTDGGETWSSPFRVNQDVTDKDQWLPWIAADLSTGKLQVIYYDSRNFVNNDSAEVFISVSTDGGASFRDTLVSDAPFLPTAVWNASIVPYYMGSYIGIASAHDTVWTVWTDTRPGIHQAYAALTPNRSHGLVAHVVPASGELDRNRDTVRVYARVDDSEGISISAIVQSPDGIPMDTIALADDGMHDDSLAGDGLFSNAWIPGDQSAYWVDLELRYYWQLDYYVNNFAVFDPVTAVSPDGTSQPLDFSLSQNYPNPFNPSTSISYQLPVASGVKLTVYDLLGREVSMLVNAKEEAGYHEIPFDGAGLASGVYLYRLTAGSFVQTRKMLVIK
jgi:hypothetical protein